MGEMAFHNPLSACCSTPTTSQLNSDHYVQQPGRAVGRSRTWSAASESNEKSLSDPKFVLVNGIKYVKAPTTTKSSTLNFFDDANIDAPPPPPTPSVRTNEPKSYTKDTVWNNANWGGRNTSWCDEMKIGVCPNVPFYEAATVVPADGVFGKPTVPVLTEDKHKFQVHRGVLEHLLHHETHLHQLRAFDLGEMQEIQILGVRASTFSRLLEILYCRGDSAKAAVIGDLQWYELGDLYILAAKYHLDAVQQALLENWWYPDDATSFIYGAEDVYNSPSCDEKFRTFFKNGLCTWLATKDIMTGVHSDDVASLKAFLRNNLKASNLMALDVKEAVTEYTISRTQGIGLDEEDYEYTTRRSHGNASRVESCISK